MKLRAVITIEVDAADFVEAAAHQRRLEDLMQAFLSDYPAAVLTFRERRSARRTARGGDRLPLRPSGRLRTYDS